MTATNVAGTTEGTTLIARNPYLYRGYRYDAETGLYYLNSRYYDPRTGRFINADVFVSTAQDSISCNMFAYCMNNPINSVDDEGYSALSFLWYILLSNMDFGFIHELVQLHIITNNPGRDLSAERWLTKPDGSLGRADIVENNREVWEIKHNNLQAAALQVNQYVGGKLKRGGQTVSLGRAGAFYGRFTFNLMGTTYSVNYSTPQPGVIIYQIEPNAEYEMNPDYVYVSRKERAQAKVVPNPAVTIACLGIIAIGVAGGSGFRNAFARLHSY